MFPPLITPKYTYSLESLCPNSMIVLLGSPRLPTLHSLYPLPFSLIEITVRRIRDNELTSGLQNF